MTRKPFLAALAAFILIFHSCRREDARPSWETEILTPLLKGTLSINEIVSDTLMQANADSSLKLVYQNHLYDFTVDTLFNFFDTSVTKSYKLDSINLLNQKVVYPISLGEICKNAGIAGAIIISQNGNTLPIPAFGPLSSGSTNINADTLFQTMTLITGMMDVKLVNGLPVDITNVAFLLQNTSNQDTIVYGTFPLIPAGDSVMQSYPLDGKTVEGNMTANLVSLSSPGSGGNPVLIDTSDAVIAELRVHDLHPLTATAIFPAQDLVNKSQKFILKGLPVELKYARVRSGFVSVAMYSTLQDSVKFTYELPSASIGGVPFTIKHTLPPAPVGGVSSYTDSRDFSGYEVDFSGQNHDTVNTMYNTFIASIDSTGLMKTISLTDSFYANIGFVDILPEYARGYLGNDTFLIGPGQAPVEIFNKITVDQFSLEDVDLSITANNGTGMDATVSINQMESVNTKKNTTVPLTGSVLTAPINIVRATDNGGFQPVNYTNTTLQINNSNSNASSFIENLPNQVNYSLSLITNPNGNVLNYGDFIHYTDGIKFDLNLEIPLSLIAGNLVLTDTLDFALNEVDLDQITGGTMTLIAKNGFPLDMHLQLYMLNEAGTIIDSLLTQNLILAAPIGNNNKVKEKRESRLLIPVTPERIDELFICKKMLIKARLDTKPPNQFVKIYSDYTMDFQLTGDFNFLTK
jgi:hypothetical protein